MLLFQRLRKKQWTLNYCALQHLCNIAIQVYNTEYALRNVFTRLKSTFAVLSAIFLANFELCCGAEVFFVRDSSGKQANMKCFRSLSLKGGILPNFGLTQKNLVASLRERTVQGGLGFGRRNHSTIL